MKWPIVFLLALASSCSTRTATRARTVSPLEQFAQLVNSYVDMRKDLQGKLPLLKDKAEPERIVEHQTLLQSSLRARRSAAKQGDIFIPGVRTHFQRVLKAELSGPANKPNRDAVKESNPRGGEEPSPKPVTLAVNAVYPKEAPLTTVPPSVLLKLPKLPEELEYRFVGKTLILRDTIANIIVDYLPEVSP